MLFEDSLRDRGCTASRSIAFDGGRAETPLQ
jgi:hypothetical protein